MPKEVACESCGSKFQVSDDQDGIKLRCPQCQNSEDIPSDSANDDKNVNPFTFLEKAGSQQASPAPSANPYAAPVLPTGRGLRGTKSDGSAYSEFEPLLGSVFFIKAIAWMMIITGVVYCLTIIGLVIAWLPIWMGICLKNAAEGIERGCRLGDRGAIFRATSNLATFFKGMGVIAIIYLAIFMLYFGIVVIALIAGLVSAATA